MEIVKHCIEHLKQSEIQIGSSTIYSILVNSDITIENEKEFKQQIIPEIYKLIENGKIRKEILFISLLLKPHILKILLEHEAVIIKLDLRKPTTPFDFVYYENKHWLSEVIESVTEHSYLRSDIHTLLLVLKIISITNSNKLDIQELKYYLGLNYENVGLFYKIYLENLELVTKVVEFIESNSTENACNIFKVLSENSLLNSLSEMVNISNPTLWNDIFRFLVENQNFNKKYFNHSSNNQSIYTDEEKFVAFTILISIINCLKVSENLNKSPCNKDNITSTLEEVKEKLINLKNRTLQIELLEDIFALIFLRNSDIKGSKTDSFFCGESEIRLILSLLKSVFEELKKQYSSRGFSEFKRFVDLNKHITDGYWRLELLSSIKKNWYLENDGTKSKSKNILYYMLSSPEGLINMCLKQNNIEKAIQVVKVRSIMFL
ncbi:hypothetical protein QE152_g4549 [Popillia japonica]|uniref:Uncharacterized protein n=1 Tax=Popillia japonica TaxID=7064 RepID=A0AAW1N1Y4_POPJA